MDLTMRRLESGEVTEIYERHMVRDFPKSELKPLALILEKMEKGLYVPYGLLDGQERIGYAFFGRGRNTGYLLLDYLAVFPQFRSGGYGTRLLPVLASYVEEGGYDGIVGEVEDPAFFQSEEDRQIKERRLQFYLRDRFEQTDIACQMFGTEMLILKLDFKNADTDEVYRCFEDLYQANYTEEQRRHVKLRKL